MNMSYIVMLIIVFMAQLNQRNGKKSVKHSFWMLGRWTQGRKGHFPLRSEWTHLNRFFAHEATFFLLFVWDLSLSPILSNTDPFKCFFKNAKNFFALIFMLPS